MADLGFYRFMCVYVTNTKLSICSKYFDLNNGNNRIISNCYLNLLVECFISDI